MNAGDNGYLTPTPTPDINFDPSPTPISQGSRAFGSMLRNNSQNPLPTYNPTGTSR